MNQSATSKPSNKRKCPICGKPVADDPREKYFPFCGERCKTIDLARWADGKYTISRPIEEKDLEDGE